MKFLTTLTLTFSVVGITTHASLPADCSVALAMVGKTSDQTSLYLSLVRKLALEKGALTSEDLQRLASHESVQNPLEFVSQNISAGQNFAFERAFKSFGNVNWNRAKRELIKIVKELEERNQVKVEAKAGTAPVYAAVEIQNITSRQKIAWSDQALFPRGKNPMFISNREDGSYLVDLETQTMTLFQPFRIDGGSFLETQGGGILFAYPIYYDESFLVRLEDLRSRTVIGEYHPTPRVRNDLNLQKNGKIEVRVFQNENGTLKIVGSRSVGADAYFTYDFDTKKETSAILPRKRNSRHHSVVGARGDVFSLQSIHSLDANEVTTAFWQMKNDEFILVGEPHVMSFISNFQRALHLADGRVVFAEVTSLNGLTVFSSDQNHTRSFSLPSSERDEEMHFAVEWPPGQVSSFIEKYQGDTEVSLITPQGDIKKLYLPPGTQNGYLSSVELASGREILVSHATNMNEEEDNSETQIIFYDFSQNTFHLLNLPKLKNIWFVKAYSLNDGRILGIFTEDNGVTRVLQLYGPILGRGATP